eukprot:12230438-Heterocapsa_arctica.AAC.1
MLSIHLIIALQSRVDHGLADTRSLSLRLGPRRAAQPFTPRASSRASGGSSSEPRRAGPRLYAAKRKLEPSAQYALNQQEEPRLLLIHTVQYIAGR